MLELNDTACYPGSPACRCRSQDFSASKTMGADSHNKSLLYMYIYILFLLFFWRMLTTAVELPYQFKLGKALSQSFLPPSIWFLNPPFNVCMCRFETMYLNTTMCKDVWKCCAMFCINSTAELLNPPLHLYQTLSMPYLYPQMSVASFKVATLGSGGIIPQMQAWIGLPRIFIFHLIGLRRATKLCSTFWTSIF